MSSILPNGNCVEVVVTSDNSAILASCNTTITGGGGGISDGDKGDITVSGSGATWTVDNDAVTFAKMQNVEEACLLGRESGVGTGDPKVVKLDTQFVWTTIGGKPALSVSVPSDASKVSTATQVISGTGLTGGGTLSGNVTLSANFGTSSGTVCQGNDSRLTDARTPTAHTHGVGDLTAGTASTNDVLVFNGTAWAPAALAVSGTKTYAFFTPLDAQPPASNFATLDTRQDIAVLEFDGGATDESTTFVGIMPEGASLGSGLKVRIHWMADTANTSSNVRWGVQFQRLTDDVDAAAYDTAVEGNSAAPTGTGADGTPAVLELTVTTIDGITAGDAYRLKVYREASDTTNDTMSGDAQLIAVEVRSAA